MASNDAASGRKGKVTVVGAGFYGSTTAQRLAEYDIFDEVVLTDIVEGKPEGLALDMSQSRPIEGFETHVVGATTGPDGEGYEETAGSDIVVITAGLPRKPGMSRMDLIETNAKIVRQVAEQVAKFSPDAVDHRRLEPARRDDRADRQRDGLPEAARHRPGRHARHRAVQAEGRRPARRTDLQRRGHHPRARTATPWCRCRRWCTVDGKPLSEVLDQATIDELVERTRNGGAEIVALLKTGSAYYAPSAAAARMAGRSPRTPAR